MSDKPKTPGVFPEMLPDWEDLYRNLPGPDSGDTLLVTPEGLREMEEHATKVSGQNFSNMASIKVVSSEHLPEGVAAMMLGATPEGSVTVMEKFPEHILAELRYEFDGSTWAALVTRLDGNPPRDEPGFQLWYQRGQRYQKSGTFTNAKALKKYIRQAAAEKFEGFTPVVDTLDKLKHRTANSVVPDCYQAGLFSDEEKCRKCPYSRKCVNPHLDGQEQEQVQEAAEEPEELFQKRLREKMKAKWGSQS